MTTINKSILINAPVEDVEALMDDQDRLPEWYAGVTAAEAEPGYPEEIGSSNNITYKAAGITFKTKLTTLEFVPREQRKFKMEGMVTGTNHWQLTAEGDSTRVDLTFDYEMPGGGLGKIADKLVVERTNDKNAETSLANLKALAEGG
jgi:uncharacterized membrane protein